MGAHGTDCYKLNSHLLAMKLSI